MKNGFGTCGKQRRKWKYTIDVRITTKGNKRNDIGRNEQLRNRKDKYASDWRKWKERRIFVRKRKTNRHETNIIRMAENERKTVILKKEWIIIDKE